MDSPNPVLPRGYLWNRDTLEDPFARLCPVLARSRKLGTCPKPRARIDPADVGEV
jgi:hypothetical protein